MYQVKDNNDENNDLSNNISQSSDQVINITEEPESLVVSDLSISDNNLINRKNSKVILNINENPENFEEIDASENSKDMFPQNIPTNCVRQNFSRTHVPQNFPFL